MSLENSIPILYVTPSSGPEGANFSLIRLLANLDRERFRPYVVCPAPAQDLLREMLDEIDVPLYPHYMEEWGQMEEGRIHLRRLLAWPKRSALRLRTVLSLALFIRRRHIGLVHTNSVLAIEGALAAKLAGVPHVWHIRDRIGPEGNVQFRAGYQNAARHIAMLSQAILAISNYVREPFEPFCMPGRLHTIPNSVDLHDFLEARGEGVREEFGIPEGSPIITTIGHITPEKRQVDFVQAAARIRERLPEARFLIVGKHLDFHRAYAEQLDRLIGSLRLKDAVIFTGLRRDIPRILAATDLMIHPRVNEGFGRVIIEAMAAGKPVVSVRRGGPAEIIQDRVTGRLVTPATPPELADAAIEILQAPDLARAMGKAARQHVRRCYTDATYVANIEAIYRVISGGQVRLSAGQKDRRAGSNCQMFNVPLQPPSSQTGREEGQCAHG